MLLPEQWSLVVELVVRDPFWQLTADGQAAVRRRPGVRTEGAGESAPPSGQSGRAAPQMRVVRQHLEHLEH